MSSNIYGSQSQDLQRDAVLVVGETEASSRPRPAAGPGAEPDAQPARARPGSRCGSTGAEDALARLYALAQALGSDLGRFQALVGRR